MKTSEEIIDLSKAMAKMQGEMTFVPKDCKGYNYKYADLASIWGVIREPLQNNGLFVVQDAITLPEGVSVTTRVIHTSGQWMEFGPLVVPMGNKKDAHATGSGITYAKRYGICSALSVITEETVRDDDGAAAMKNPPVEIKPVQLCTQDEYDSFIEEWSKTFEREKIELYISKRSAFHKVDPKETVSVLMSDQNKFEKEIKVWEPKV